MSAVLVVYLSIEKLLPRQHVSAFVSHSLYALVPASGSADLVIVAATFRRKDVTGLIEAVCQDDLLLLLREWACSFRPPIIVPVVTWLTLVGVIDRSIGGC